MLLLHGEPGFSILGYDLPRMHAVLNDFPVILVVAVLFEIAALLTRRESLRSAAFWMLVVGIVGTAAAVGSGLLAEETIEHGDAIHEVMEEHERLGLITLGVFFVVAAWHIVRRLQMSRGERWAAALVGLVGAGLLVSTGAHGGELVFDHAAGIRNEVLQSELENRGAGHEHEEGEDHDEPAGGRTGGQADSDTVRTMSSDSVADTTKAQKGHTHAPGTAPHEH